MRFKATTTFLDGTDRFEINDERTIAEERGAYFVGNGWGIDLDGRVATADQSSEKTDLNIHNSGSATGDSNG